MKKLLFIFSIFFTTTMASAQFDNFPYFRAVVGSAGDERVKSCSQPSRYLGLFFTSEDSYKPVNADGETISELREKACEGRGEGDFILVCYNLATTADPVDDSFTDFTEPDLPPSTLLTVHESWVVCGPYTHLAIDAVLNYVVTRFYAN